MNPFRGIACLLGWCAFRPKADETGCWGECEKCGKRAGFVDRATLRGYADREWANRDR